MLLGPMTSQLYGAKGFLQHFGQRLDIWWFSSIVLLNCVCVCVRACVCVRVRVCVSVSEEGEGNKLRLQNIGIFNKKRRLTG